MAQHDYVIANGTGAAVRSDINNGLAAIVSNNSGATEPATMYAYQWWADTTTGLLKIRNAANNGWITVGTLASANLGLLAPAGTLTAALGSASTPGITFTGDTNTGIYSPGADQVAISTGGTVRLSLSTTAVSSALAIDHPLGAVGTPSITFTGDLNTGIYSPGADQVAISTNGTGRLFVNSTGQIFAGQSAVLSDASSPRFELTGDVVINTATTGVGTEAALNFYHLVSTSTATRAGARISSVSTGTYTAGTAASNDADFTIATSLNGTLTERMRISSTGTTTLTSAASTAPFIANISATEVARIDSSGRFLVGTSTSIGTSGGFTPSIQVAANTSAAMSVGRYVNSANGPSVVMQKSRNATIGAHTIVNSGDAVGSLTFEGSDGSAFINAAQIKAEVDGTPGADDMPGRLIFATTAVGASSPTERLRITNDGVKAYDQPAPAAVNATATLTVANLKNGIITSTSAAATDMTLPTGTDTEAGFSGVYANMTFEWSVINTGPSLVRVLAGTAHAIVGSGSVAAGTSGRFASRRSVTANTFVSYRLA
jgi:hypothetical protein